MSLLQSTATVLNPTTLILDTPLASNKGKVQVEINDIADHSPVRATLQDWLAALRIRQSARGHIPRCATEIDADIAAGREER